MIQRKHCNCHLWKSACGAYRVTHGEFGNRHHLCYSPVTETTPLDGRLVALLIAGVRAQAPPTASERVDLEALYRIKDEGLQRSEVMDTLWYLTDVHGPRLTNSPNIRAAAAWAMKRLTEWGVTNVRQEPWGPFGRGWANDKLVAHVTAPQPFPLIAAPRAWTPGTNGTVSADVVHAVIDDEGDFKEWTGKLKGKAVLVAAMPEVRALFAAPGRRFTDQDLTDMQSQPVNVGRGGRGGRAGGPAPDPTFPVKRALFFAREGVAAMLEPQRPLRSRRHSGGNSPRQYRDPRTQTVPTHRREEHYNRRFGSRENVPVTLELKFITAHRRYVDSFNIIADIPGPIALRHRLARAHFDSCSGDRAPDKRCGVER